MEKGRNELILESIIHQTVYTDPPESRIEDLLLQLKDVIEGGEGGEFDPDNYYTKTETDYEITEKVTEIVADAPEDFDTLKEMSDWIDSHEDSAAAMNSAIQANTTAIAGKVDKVTGKGLSTEDYTPAEKTKLAGLSNYDDTALQTAVANKVDKVAGKGLSTEDYTSAEKTKLAGIDTNATAVGKNVTGTSYTIDGQTVVAGDGAEIFNNYSNNIASGAGSHAEGWRNTASGSYAHAEGYRTAAGANCSHAEGSVNTISSAATNSHVEGFENTVSGNTSHAEGTENTVSGYYSHAEGIGNIISGSESHAEGFHNLVYSDNQHVQGKYNVADSNNKYAFIIGNGTADDARSNAFAVDWNGLIYINNAATGVNLATLASTITSLESRLSALENAGFLTSSDLPSMTQAQYDALQTKDKPYYFIVEE